MRVAAPARRPSCPCGRRCSVLFFWGCLLCLLFVCLGCRRRCRRRRPSFVFVARLVRLLLGCFCGCGRRGCGGGLFVGGGRRRFRRRCWRLRLRCLLVACGRCFRRPLLRVVCFVVWCVLLLCRLVFVVRFGRRGCRCGRVFVGEVVVVFSVVVSAPSSPWPLARFACPSRSAVARLLWRLRLARLSWFLVSSRLRLRSSRPARCPVPVRSLRAFWWSRSWGVPVVVAVCSGGRVLWSSRVFRCWRFGRSRRSLRFSRSLLGGCPSGLPVLGFALGSVSRRLARVLW